MWMLLALSVISICVFYIYSTWTFGRFKGTNVPYLKPVPFAGNILRYMLMREDTVQNFGKFYTLFPKHRFAGMFQMRLPSLVLRDPELIRQIGVKDFDSFVNHVPFCDTTADPVLVNSLFSLQDQKWRDMRATLSPAFTGCKMKQMFSLVSDCVDQLLSFLDQETEFQGSLEIELKQLITKFANDVIATCALGVKVDTLKNPDNIFYKMGQKVSNLSGFWKSITLLGFIIAPRLMKLLNAKIIEENCANFFTKLVTETMAKREKEGITRLDMIHLLMKARKGALHSEVLNETSKETESYAAAESHADKLKSHKRAWTDVEITGQVLLFFFAGFESTSTGSCFIAYELAINPDIQRKLQEEIDQVCNEQDSLGEKHLNYEKLHRMKFLDMVVSEGLRKWPPGPYVDRHCNKDYVFEDFDGSKFEMKKGESIVIPIYNLHRDENYFPDPDKFDPYRFNEENKHKIKPFTYVPFGVGPRNCIGSRFALMEIKSLLFGILRNFDILPCEKTQIPMKLAKSSILLKPENGFWLKFQRRSR